MYFWRIIIYISYEGSIEETMMKNSNYYLKTLIPFNEDSIEEVLHTCEDAIKKMIKIQDVVFRLSFALQELVVNSLEHGYKKVPGNISISISKDKNAIYLEVADEGTGIDVSSFELKNEIQGLEELGSRGLGLHVMSKLFDRIEITPNTPQGTKVSLTILI